MGYNYIHRFRYIVAIYDKIDVSTPLTNPRWFLMIPISVNLSDKVPIIAMGLKSSMNCLQIEV